MKTRQFLQKAQKIYLSNTIETVARPAALLLLIVQILYIIYVEIKIQFHLTILKMSYIIFYSKFILCNTNLFNVNVCSG